MLASCVAAVPAPREEHEGSCDEDFVKSFIPSLFDSDSDADDGCCLQSPPLGAAPPRTAPLDLPGRQQLAHLQVLRRSASTAAGSDGSPEACSPSSVGGASSLSAFTGAALAGEASGDEAPGFQSLLSLSSAASALAPFESDERPAKRARIADAAGGGLQPMASICSVGSGLPRNSSLCCLEPQQPPALHSAAATPPLPPAPWVTRPVAPPSPCLLPEAGGPWPAPQGMIPTAPTAAFSTEPEAPPAPAAAPLQQQQPGPPGGMAAALQELHSPSARPPLGLKLDKAAVAQQLRALGMTLTGA